MTHPSRRGCFAKDPVVRGTAVVPMKGLTKRFQISRDASGSAAEGANRLVLSIHKPPDSTSRPKTIKYIFCNCELQYDFALFSPTYNDIWVIINPQIINKTEIK